MHAIYDPVQRTVSAQGDATMVMGDVELEPFSVDDAGVLEIQSSRWFRSKKACEADRAKVREQDR